MELEPESRTKPSSGGQKPEALWWRLAPDKDILEAEEQPESQEQKRIMVSTCLQEDNKFLTALKTLEGPL